jgi:hypothetical protein
MIAAIALVAFRVWRGVARQRDAEWSGRLAGTDYLLLAPIVLSAFLVILPLLTLPNPSAAVLTIAQGSCTVSAASIAAYPFAILEQRRGQNTLFVGACALTVLIALGIFQYC